MLNYLKSEFYRVTKSRDIYVMTGLAAGLTVLMNVVLWYFKSVDAGFTYGTTKFSLNMMIGSLSFVMAGGFIAAVLVFADEYKNGTIKNVVSFGISRTQFFIGKCIVAVVTAVTCLIVIEVIHVGTAYMLLENSGAEPLHVLLQGLATVLPATIGALILGTAALCCMQKLTNAMACWFSVFYLFPVICDQIGRKSELFARIARWLPHHQFAKEVMPRMGSYQCIWDTSEGLFRCLVTGAAIIVISVILGIIVFRRKAIH